MEVILFEDVKGLGRQGDKVRVADGYFRNYLKPNGLADEATPGNIKKFENMRKRQTKLAAEKKAEAEAIAKKLAGVTVSVRAKAGESDKLFGAVTSQQVAEALEAGGYLVDKKQIEIAEPVKKLGLFTIGVKIHPEVEAKFNLLVERL